MYIYIYERFFKCRYIAKSLLRSHGKKSYNPSLCPNKGSERASILSRIVLAGSGTVGVTSQSLAVVTQNSGAVPGLKSGWEHAFAVEVRNGNWEGMFFLYFS